MMKIIGFLLVFANCLGVFINLTDGSDINLIVGAFNLFAACFLSFVIGVVRRRAK